MKETTMHPALLPGAHVATPSRNGVGVVLHHHPSLPAWVVDFDEDASYPLAWMDERLEVLA